jgi:hypothetical protein
MGRQLGDRAHQASQQEGRRRQLSPETETGTALSPHAIRRNIRKGSVLRECLLAQGLQLCALFKILTG